MSKSLLKIATRLFALLLVFSLVATACGSSDDAASSGGDDAAETDGGDSGGGDGVAEAQELVAAAAEPVTFSVPDGVGPIDLSLTEGRRVAVINLVAAVPILTQWQNELEQAMEGSGVELSFFDGNFDPSEWSRGIENAIADQVDVIFLLGVPAQAVAPAIADATAAGIPVLTSLQGSPGKSLADVPDLTADVGFDYRIPGEIMGQWFVADSNGQGNALIMSSDDNSSSPDVWGGIEDEITRLCPDCTFTREDSTVPEWSDGTLQTRARSLIQADPSITHVIAVFDAMTLAIEPALVELGVEDEIRVAGFNGTPAVMANVQAGTAVTIDVGNPNLWYSAGSADAIMSVLQGEDVIEDHNVPFRLFSADNLDGIDTSVEDPVDWYGIDPLAEYRAIWGFGG